MVTLSWELNPDSDNILTYHVQRAFVGVETLLAAPYNLLTSETMQVRVDGGDLIDISFAAVTNGAATATEVATTINGQLFNYGGSARVTDAGDRVIIESNRQSDKGSLLIKAGGSALTKLGILADEYKEESNPIEVGTITPPTVEFTDEDGVAGYKYRIIAEDTSNNCSRPTDYFTPVLEEVPSSVIYGTIVDPDGQPVKDAIIKYSPPLNKRPSDDTKTAYPFNKDAEVGISIQLKEVYTNENGYWQIVVPANVALRLKIDSVGFDWAVTTPSDGTTSKYTKLNRAFDFESFALDGDIFRGSGVNGHGRNIPF